MALKHKGTEAAAVDQEPKKRKRVGFVATDAGIEPNDCIKIFAVLAGYNVPFGEGALHARRGGDE